VYFPLYIFCSFIEKLFAVNYYTRLKSTNPTQQYLMLHERTMDLNMWQCRNAEYPDVVTKSSEYQKDPQQECLQTQVYDEPNKAW
jgi:hypothetical protein